MRFVIDKIPTTSSFRVTVRCRTGFSRNISLAAPSDSPESMVYKGEDITSETLIALASRSFMSTRVIKSVLVMIPI